MAIILIPYSLLGTPRDPLRTAGPHGASGGGPHGAGGPTPSRPRGRPQAPRTDIDNSQYLIVKGIRQLGN